MNQDFYVAVILILAGLIACISLNLHFTIERNRTLQERVTLLEGMNRFKSRIIEKYIGDLK